MDDLISRDEVIGMLNEHIASEEALLNEISRGGSPDEDGTEQLEEDDITRFLIIAAMRSVYVSVKNIVRKMPSEGERDDT